MSHKFAGLTLFGIMSLMSILRSEDASAGAIVGPAVEVDEPISGIVTLPVQYFAVQTASDGRTILTVWKACSGNVCGLYAAALDLESQTVIQPEGLLIAEVSAADNLGPYLAIDNADTGGDFIVVWVDAYTGAHFSVVHTVGGEVEAVPSVLIQEKVNFGYFIDITELSCTAMNCYIKWQMYPPQSCSGSTGAEVGAVTVDMFTGEWSDGAPELISKGIPVDGLGYLTVAVATSCNTSPCETALVGQITDDSSGLTTTVFSIDLGGVSPSNMDIVSNGKDFLVVWKEDIYNENTLGSDSTAKAARVNGDDFSVIDTTPIEIYASRSDWVSSMPIVQSNGIDYLVGWSEWSNTTVSEEIYSAIIRSRDGTVIVAEPRLSNKYADCGLDGADTAEGNTDFFVTECTNAGLTGIWISGEDGSVVSTESFITAPQQSIAANDQEGIAVASDGGNYLVVWSDSRNADQSGRDIYAAVFDATGQRLTDESILVTGAQGDQVLPAVAYNGKDFIVVWQDARNFNTDSWDIYAARISGDDFSVMDADGIPVRQATTYDGEVPSYTGSHRPRVVALSDSFLVLWASSFNDQLIYAETEPTTAVYGALINDETGANSTPDGFHIRDGLLGGAAVVGDTAYVVSYPLESRLYNDAAFVTAVNIEVGQASISQDSLQLSGILDVSDVTAEDSRLWIIQGLGSIEVQPIDPAAFFPPEEGTSISVDISNTDSTVPNNSALKIFGDNGFVGYRNDDGSLQGAVIRFASSDSPKAEPLFDIESVTISGAPTIDTNGTNFIVSYSQCEDVCRAKTRIITLTDEINIDTDTDTDSTVDPGTDADTAENADTDTPTDNTVSEDSGSGGGCSAAPLNHANTSLVDIVEVILLTALSS